MIDMHEKKQLKAINKQEKQLKEIMDQKKNSSIRKLKGKKNKKKITLLKDNLNNILEVFEKNFDNKGKSILKKNANDRMINYNNLVFKRGNLFINNFGFLKTFRTLYDLLTDLLKSNKH